MVSLYPGSENDLKIENMVVTGRDMPNYWRNIFPHPGIHGCWEWVGKRNRAGYGLWKGQLTHRIMYYIANGRLPDASRQRVVAHLCCNEWCCRPDHLQDCHKSENNRHRDQWRTMPNGFRLNVAQAQIDQKRRYEGMRQ